LNVFTKIFFWSATILLGFVNPLISITLVVLYYLPKIISDIVQPCEEIHLNSNMKLYSDDVVEEMK